MNPKGAEFIFFMSTSPLFKGISVIIAGCLALLFAFFMRKRFNEPLKAGFLIFIGIAVFVVLYGLFVLIFQPQWWKLPY